MLSRARDGIDRAGDDVPRYPRYAAIMRLFSAARGPRPGRSSRWRPSWPRSWSHSGGRSRRAGKCAVRDDPSVLRSVASWRCRRLARTRARCPAAGGRRVFPAARRRMRPLTAHWSLPVTGPRSLLVAGPSVLRATALAFPRTGQRVRIASRGRFPRLGQACQAAEPAGADRWAGRVTASASGPLLREPGRRQPNPAGR